MEKWYFSFLSTESGTRSTLHSIIHPLLSAVGQLGNSFTRLEVPAQQHGSTFYRALPLEQSGSSRLLCAF